MKSSFKYLPQLDGIRAIAIIPVLIFHLNSAWLPGGFLGVDVFFVLSAFLITSIIINQDSFSFKDFYNKRIKRIIPPLYAVVAGTSIASFFLLARDDYEYLKESIELILIFSANLFFARQGDYFGPNILEKPLLHTWSLAIEEQFYFFWPVLLLLFLKRMPRTLRYTTLLLLIAASMLYGEFLLQDFTSEHSAYYSSFARFGQMLIGALGALIVRDLPSHSISPLLSKFFFYSGLVVLFFYFLYFQKDWAYPGLNSMLPTLASLSLILGAFHLTESSSSIVSNTLSVWVGKVSYSLYLWHWPVLALFRYRVDETTLSTGQIVLALILIFSLTCGSYYLIEKHTRHKTFSFKKTLVRYLLAPAILISLMNLVLLNLSGKLSSEGGRQVRSDRCHDKMLSSCSIGAEDVPVTILAFGDSHLGHLNGFLDYLGKKEGWRADAVSIGDCRPIFGVNKEVLKTNSRFAKCNELHQWVKEHLNNYSTIFIAGRWESYFEKDDLHAPENFKKTLELLKDRNRHVVVFSQVRRPLINPKKSQAIIPVKRLREYSHIEKVNNLVHSTLPDYIQWVDLHKISLEIEPNAVNYYDTHHLTETGSEALAKKFIDFGRVITPQHHEKEAGSR